MFQLKAIADALDRAFPPKEKQVCGDWTKRDELAWGLYFHHTSNDDLTSEDFRIDEVIAQRTIKLCYEQVDMFLRYKRSKAAKSR